MYENNFLDPAYITPEEQQILDGNIAVQKNLYTSKQDFVVESDKFLKHSEDDMSPPRGTSIYEPTYRTCGNSLRPGRSGH